MKLLSALTVSVVLFAIGTATAGQKGGPDPALEAAVTKFVQFEFEHGVPYKEAHDFGPQALPVLVALLNNDGFKHHWANIVQVICFIGSPAGFEPLRTFVQDRFRGEVDSDTFYALEAAEFSLGPVAAVSPEALNYLIKGTDPAYWSTLHWTHQGRQGERLHILWSKLSINALSMTGNARAGEALEKLQRQPFSERQRSNIAEGLARHKTIVSLGLSSYLLKRQSGEIKY